MTCVSRWWLNFGEDGWLAFWRSMPWRCRLGLHRPRTYASYNENAPFVPEEEWIACERCHLFFGYVA